MIEKGNAHELPLGHIGLLRVFKLNEDIATILIQNLYFLNISVVAEKVEQICDLLLIIISIWQILNHEDFGKLVVATTAIACLVLKMRAFQTGTII